MNWASVVFGGAVLICFANYLLRAHKLYRGPVALIKKE
jgi:hypothetical protein